MSDTRANIKRCRSSNCNAMIVFLPNANGRIVAVDFNTWGAGESAFIPNKHVNHWQTCKDADRFARERDERERARKRDAGAGQGELF